MLFICSEVTNYLTKILVVILATSSSYANAEIPKNTEEIDEISIEGFWRSRPAENDQASAKNFISSFAIKEDRKTLWGIILTTDLNLKSQREKNTGQPLPIFRRLYGKRLIGEKLEPPHYEIKFKESDGTITTSLLFVKNNFNGLATKLTGETIRDFNDSHGKVNKITYKWTAYRVARN